MPTACSTPGLIDPYAPTYPYASAVGIPANELVAQECTVTVVSAGDAGANDIAAVRPFIVPGTRTRQYAFVHIAVGSVGFRVPELFSVNDAQLSMAVRAVAESADLVLGVKVRMSETVIARHGLEPLKRAVAAREQSGVPVRAMCHIGGVATGDLMS